jgi:Sulfotransferase family
VTTRSASAAEAVFVVGVNRSGTTLMRRILEASSTLAVAAESHYLGHLVARQGVHHAVSRLGDLRDEEAVERVVAHIYDGGLRRRSWFREPSRQWVWLLRKVPRSEFRERLMASDRTERAVFETLLRAYADRRGKPTIGEKTPAHFRYSETLLSWFPGGRVIHMLRDPRAIYVSDLRRRRLEPGSLPYRILTRVPPALAGVLLVQTTLAWQESLVRLKRSRARHPDRYLVVRFEDLVAAPRKEVERICGFLGIVFEEPMLRQVVVSHGQAEGSAGFDVGAANRWRSQLGRGAALWFRVWLGSRMRSSGYDS